MLTSNIVFHFVAIGCLTVNHGLEEISPNITPTDTMRHVVNQMFSTLELKTNKYPKLKEYLMIHKYFVSVNSLEIQSRKEVTKLIGLDTKIDNSTAEYIAVINEVLNEQTTTEDMNGTKNDETVDNYVDNFLNTLALLKEAFLVNNAYDGINSEILSHFNESNTSHVNDTYSEVYSTENDVDENEFWVPTETRRVYRGSKTKIKYFPFLASVQLFNQFSCAGSIIKSDLVITAASCLQLAHNNRFYRENPAFLSVRIGSSFYNGGGENIPVVEVYFYPTYTPKTLRDNLAVMRLLRTIRFKRKKPVRKIITDDNPHTLPLDTGGITIVGWGAKTTSNKVHNPWTNKVSMDILDIYPLDDCQDIYSKVYVTKKHFCAGFLSKGGGACNRDVGAPGLVRGVLVGVVSFGAPSCGVADSPTVFTKLGYYAKWIDEIKEQKTVTYNVRTTTRLPYIQTISTVTMEDRTFKMEPILDDSEKSYQEPEIRSDQKKVFKEFLETVFNSKESEQYESKFSGFLKSKKHKENIEKNSEEIKMKLPDLNRVGGEKGSKSEENSEHIRSVESVKSVTTIDRFNPDDISKESGIEETSISTDHTGSDKKIRKNSKPQLRKVKKPSTVDNNIERDESEVGLTIEDVVIQSGAELKQTDTTRVEKNIDLVNATEEELDKQIDKLIQNLNIVKVISSKLSENFNDKEIDEKQLMDFFDEDQDEKKRIPWMEMF